MNHIKEELSEAIGVTKTISCTHKDFLVMSRDEIVSELPDKDSIGIHGCPQVMVYQEYRGLKRYFIVKEMLENSANEPEKIQEKLYGEN